MKNYKEKLKMNRGFTLIELLVVIAIIGVLSGIVIVAVGDATARARDSRRLADARQLAFVLERETALGPAIALSGCTPTGAAFASITACTIVATPPRLAVDRYFGAIVDPAYVGPTVCGTATEGPCGYGIRRETADGIARTDDYRICFWLETDVPGPCDAGLCSIRTGAHMVDGCTP